MADYTTWRTNAFENINPPPDGWPEHAPPRTINGVAREMESAMRRRADRSGLYPTSTGDGDTYIVVLSDMPVQLLRGFRVGFKAHRSSTAGAVSFQLNEFPQRALYGSDTAGINPRDIVAGRLYNLVYTGVDWSILNTSPLDQEASVPLEFVPDVMTGVDAGSVDGLSLSTAATGTDANTLYFRTTNGGEIYHGANRVESIALSGTTAGIVRHGANVVYARPQAVTSLLAGLPNTLAARITWGAPAVASRPIAYRLERALNSAFTGATTLGTALTTLIYNDTDLSPQTLYYYRVRAGNYIGEGPYSVVALSTSGVSPGVPRNVIGTALSASSIRVSWLAPSTGTTPFSYELQSADNSDFSNATTLATAQLTTTFTNTGLSADTTYHYRVRATNLVSTGSYASTSAATTGVPPSVPRSFSASATSANSIDLSWLAPLTGGTPVTYRVDRGTNSALTQGFVIRATAQSGLSFADTGLSAGTRYYYEVRAQNDAGNSAYVAANAMTDAPPAVAPGLVQSLSASATGQTTISVSWNAPSTGDTPFTYRVDRSTNSSFTLPATRASGLSSTFFNDTGLSAGTTYYYRVNATNDAGTGSYTSTNATTDAAPVTPGVVRNLSASATGQTTVSVSWNAPSTGDTPFTYQVQRATNSSFTASLSTRASAQSSTSYSDTGLSAGTTYYYRVRATNTAGTGSYSSTNATTPSAAVAPGLVQSLSASATGQSTVSVSWNAPSTGDTPFTYRVERATNSSFSSGRVTLVTAQSSTSRAVTGLSAGTLYYFRVRATNTAGTGSYTSTSATTNAASVVPGVVRNLSASATGQSTISVSWNAPLTGSTPITYQVQRATNSSFSSGLITLAAGQSSTSYSDTGRSAGTTYYYRVRAANFLGSSSYSSTSATTNAPPGAVSPSASATSTSRINVTWSAPTGTTPFTYRVQRATNSSFSSGLTTLATAQTTTSRAATGLSSNTLYYFRVRATNSVGTGNYGSTSATTNAVAPGTPTSVSATATDTDTVNISWSAPSTGDTPFTYRVQRRLSAGGSQVTIADGISATSFTATGLTANTRYIFRVRATNSGGSSSYTVGVAATTDSELTLAVSITAGNAGVDVEQTGFGITPVWTWEWSGSFTASPSGGTSPYSYSWTESGDGAVSGSSTSATVGITASDTTNSESNAPGDEDTTVTVTVTDAGSPQLSATASFYQEIDYSS